MQFNKVIPNVMACIFLCQVALAQSTETKHASNHAPSAVVPASLSAPGFPGKGNHADWQKATRIYNQGIDYSAAKDYPNAIKKYREAIAIYAYDPMFYTNLGFALERAADPKAGEEACRKALALDKEQWGAWENLGNCLYDQNKLTESRDAFNKALDCELPLSKRNEFLKVIGILTDKIKASGPAK